MYKVTEEHIKNGIRHGAHSCPIALCLKEYVKIKDGISVSPWTVRSRLALLEEQAEDDVFIYDYELSESLSSWIQAFDAGKTVEPIELEVIGTDIYIEGE